MTDARRKAEFITMGCRLNAAESNALAQQLGDVDNLVVINSCAVTNEAVRQTRQAIRKARRANPDAHIVVTGCAAQVDPASFSAMPEVSRVLGNAEKQRPALFLPTHNDPLIVSDIMEIEATAPQLVSAFAGKARAFVEIQNGCDHRCTFCIIPYGRGNSRSVPAGHVVEHIKQLVDNGYKEIVLTGVDVTSYGTDLPGQPNLGRLVEQILTHIPNLPRLRLSSIDGVEIDERLFDLLTGEDRLMPHVHLSLQSGDNMILKRMKRRHSRELAIDLVHHMKAKRPDIAIGADIIAGFPTEDEAMFENSLKMIVECDIVHGHIFPYSPKNGTPAALMPQVERKVIVERANLLRQAATRQRARWEVGLVGSTQSVLIENSGMAGHSENFALVTLANKAQAGTIQTMHITEYAQGKLYGEITGNAR